MIHTFILSLNCSLYWYVQEDVWASSGSLAAYLDRLPNRVFLLNYLSSFTFVNLSKIFLSFDWFISSARKCIHFLEKVLNFLQCVFYWSLNTGGGGADCGLYFGDNSASNLFELKTS